MSESRRAVHKQTGKGSYPKSLYLVHFMIKIKYYRSNNIYTITSFKEIKSELWNELNGVILK